MPLLGRSDRGDGPDSDGVEHLSEEGSSVLGHDHGAVEVDGEWAGTRPYQDPRGKPSA